MRTLRLSLTGTAILVLLGGLGAVVASAQDQSSPEPSATPKPVGEACEPIELPYDPEDIRLSGFWGSNDGGVFYISQVGSRIYLNGMSGRREAPERLGRQWSVVAIGSLADEGTMTLDYGMLPRGNDLNESGTATGRFTGQPGDATELSLHYQVSGYSQVLTPCAPATRSTTVFEPAFSFRDEARVGLSLFEVSGPYLVYMPASDRAGVESGISVWSLDSVSTTTCEGGPGQPIEPGAEAFLAWLASREDIVASNPMDVTVDGRPATMVDLTPAPGATACLEDGTKIRLWQGLGGDSAVFTDSMARVILMDVGDSTLAIEMYGDDQDTWLPLAQEVVDTIHFTE